MLHRERYFRAVHHTVPAGTPQYADGVRTGDAAVATARIQLGCNGYAEMTKIETRSPRDTDIAALETDMQWHGVHGTSFSLWN